MNKRPISTDLKKGISVVVPVFNSEASLCELITELKLALSSDQNSYEIILVEDGSADRSWNVILEIVKKNEEVHALKLMKNYGQHNALLCGIRSAKYSIVVTIDDDLQHPPQEIRKLLAKLDEGFDVVYGLPQKLPHSIIRNVLSRMTKWSLARAMGVKNISDINAFRVFRTHLRGAFDSYHSPNLILDVLLSWGTTKFGTVEIIQESRKHGKSNYTFEKLVNQFMFVMTGYSTAPLRLASMVGFVLTVFGCVVLVYVLYSYFFIEGGVPGFPFLASLISIFSGSQLFALGLMGEYLARIFDRNMERPTYVIQSKADSAFDCNVGDDKVCSTVQVNP